MKTNGISIEKIDNDFNLIINYKKNQNLVNDILQKAKIENTYSPYDPVFVEKIKSQKNLKSKKINLAQYGITL